MGLVAASPRWVLCVLCGNGLTVEAGILPAVEGGHPAARSDAGNSAFTFTSHV